jgi:hypothetical protein
VCNVNGHIVAALLHTDHRGCHVQEYSRESSSKYAWFIDDVLTSRSVRPYSGVVELTDTTAYPIFVTDHNGTTLPMPMPSNQTARRSKWTAIDQFETGLPFELDQKPCDSRHDLPFLITTAQSVGHQVDAGKPSRLVTFHPSSRTPQRPIRPR